MNINEAVAIACKEPTLLDALSWICVWESERAIKQARLNQRDADGKGWDTCFRICLKMVMEKYKSCAKCKHPDLCSTCMYNLLAPPEEDEG